MGFLPVSARPIASLSLAAALTAARPGFAQDAPAAAERTADVRFDADEPGVSLLMHTGAMPVERVTVFRHGWWYERGYKPLYAPVCEGPCVVQLAQGSYQFALAKREGRPVAAAQAIVVDGPLVLHGTYVDRGPLRAAGVILGVAGAVGGVIMIVASVHCGDTAGVCSARGSVDGPLLAGGIGVLVGSTVLGSVLLTQRDSASFALTPLVGVVSRPESTALSAARPAQGAALTLRF
jgi:hypothetical protein